MKTFTTIVLAAAAATTGVMSAAIGSSPHAVVNPDSGASFKLADSVVNSAALDRFQNAQIVHASVNLKARQILETDPDSNVTTPDNVFVLQCTDPGFRGNCLVFGSPPGQCVSYFNFDSPNSTDISDIFNNQVASLSTNTGGACQFYKHDGCDDKGDDPGLSSDYNYNLAVSLLEDPRTVEYDNAITSWRC
ncbi:hypothetical protein CGRA01v4_08928 [Colletotrichum graminicola]|uniref:Uncharacterized protein n=1 Tax=Colletotrichum graminicola (strain M1.001 / M2 / FGSC 10212) TaxID=645133 RepID=E3Q7G4_COLGM|nr:uncharacterized protein GLRG_02622 [Colletotrichum graminicola M1.001]EFQ26802.1 hypothetical protein GLRG_02622 [Colletotrichum graminicola M1.001]WDK17645.1 hypothetical protein CGRA01v4_08928 [Colletotrichum graminicola]